MGEASPTHDSETHAVARPEGQLHDYPPHIRWEVTRRHPYYLVFWRQASLFCQQQLGNDPVQLLLGQAAVAMLGSIGVTGCPVCPTTSFEALMGGNPDPKFIPGSVQPMTLRAMTAVLLGSLPPADLEAVGKLMLALARDGFAEPNQGAPLDTQRVAAMTELSKLQSSVLDSCLSAPLFFVHMGASQRSIVRDMEHQVSLWKKQHGLDSSKVHTAKAEVYLKVWDLREGWHEGAYDTARELTFDGVRQRLGNLSISTAVNRYRSAFEMIVGHPYSPELWWRLFAPVKYSQFVADPAQILLPPRLRRLTSPIRRPVPDSVVSPETDRLHASGTVERGSSVDSDIALAELLMDLKDLFGKGLRDQEVAQNLELDTSLVASLRSRIAEFDAT